MALDEAVRNELIPSNPADRVKLPRKESFMVANLIRISQTEEKLKRDAINDADIATAVHHSVGKEVRATIERVGGYMPQDLPTPDKSIAQLEKE